MSDYDGGKTWERRNNNKRTKLRRKKSLIGENLLKIVEKSNWLSLIHKLTGTRIFAIIMKMYKRGHYWKEKDNNKSRWG